MKPIFYVDANNNTPNINYPLIDILNCSFDVHFFSSDKRKYTSDFNTIYKFKNKHYLFFRITNRFGRSSVRSLLKGLEYVVNILEFLLYVMYYKPAVIHWVWIQIPFIDYLILRIVKLISNTQIIISSHNYGTHEDEQLDQYTCMIYNLADRIITHSKFVKSKLLQSGFHQTTVIDHGNCYPPIIDHFGINPGRSLIRSNDKKCINILFTGLIRAYKGVDLLLEAFEILLDHFDKDPFIRLYIAGDSIGDEIDQIEKLISQHTYKDQIIVQKGYIDWPELIATIDKAHICVLPYRSASQSGLPYLYYSMNKPAVITNVGGLMEMSDDSISVVCEPNPNEICKSIIKIAKNYSHYSQKKNFVEYLRSKDMKTVTDNYIRIYTTKA